MVNFPIFINSEGVHPRMKKNLQKRNQLCKDKPDINHLDISSGGKALRHTDEESGQDKEWSKVDCDNSLKKEVFEEVCGVDNNEDKYSRQINCENCIVDSSSESEFYVNPILFIV